MEMKKVMLWVLVAVFCCGSAFARQGGQQAGGGSSVDKDVLDFTASLMSFGFREIVTLNYYGRPGSANQIQFQPAIPFKA